MDDTDSIRIDVALMVGVSIEKAALICQVMAAHAAAESYLNAMLSIRGKRGLKSRPFKVRIKAVIADVQWANWLRLLHDARIICAHRSAMFNEIEVINALDICNKIIAEIEARYPRRVAASCATKASRLVVAMNAFLSAMVDFYKIPATEKFVLDGFHLPGKESLAEKIRKVIG